MPTLTKQRLLIPGGYIEFATLAAAQAFRDANYPGCTIIEVSEEVS